MDQDQSAILAVIIVAVLLWVGLVHTYTTMAQYGPFDAQPGAHREYR